MFTKMTDLPNTQTNIELYNCIDEAVQNYIINTFPEFFNTHPKNLLDILEVLVTQKSDPMVHRILYLLIVQSNDELVQNHLIWQWSGALDSNFIYPNCDHDLSNMYIKDQFIRGIYNDVLQEDMLAMAELLKTLEQYISHAEAVETVMQDKNKISGISGIAGLQILEIIIIMSCH